MKLVSHNLVFENFASISGRLKPLIYDKDIYVKIEQHDLFGELYLWNGNGCWNL